MAIILRACAVISKGYLCRIAQHRTAPRSLKHCTRCERLVDSWASNMGKKRKFANIERVNEADAYYCPACTQKSLKWLVFSRHLQRCCPDLLSGKDVLTIEGLERPLQLGSNVKKALQLAVEEEDALRQQLVSYMPIKFLLCHPEPGLQALHPEVHILAVLLHCCNAAIDS